MNPKGVQALHAAEVIFYKFSQDMALLCCIFLQVSHTPYKSRKKTSVTG
jgi:hypothetical protein